MFVGCLGDSAAEEDRRARGGESVNGRFMASALRRSRGGSNRSPPGLEARALASYKQALHQPPGFDAFARPAAGHSQSKALRDTLLVYASGWSPTAHVTGHKN